MSKRKKARKAAEEAAKAAELIRPSAATALGTIRFTDSGDVFPVTRIWLEDGATKLEAQLAAFQLVASHSGKYPLTVVVGNEYGLYDVDGNLVHLGWGNPPETFYLCHPMDSVDITITIVNNHGKHTTQWLSHHGL